MNNLSGIYIQRPGDVEDYQAHLQSLDRMTEEELIIEWNKLANAGICGVHGQMVYIIAVNNVIKKRLGIAPLRRTECVLHPLRPLITMCGKYVQNSDE